MSESLDEARFESFWQPEYESRGLNLCDTAALLDPEDYDQLLADLKDLSVDRRTTPFPEDLING